MSIWFTDCKLYHILVIVPLTCLFTQAKMLHTDKSLLHDNVALAYCFVKQASELLTADTGEPPPQKAMIFGPIFKNC